MQLADFDYDLPPELIAQTPLPDRDRCRLLVLHRQSGTVEHHRFDDLPGLLRPGDVLVMNDSRVLPARLFGQKPTGGRVEILLTRRQRPDAWLALVRPGLRPGQGIRFAEDLVATVEEVREDGQRLLRFDRSGAELDAAIHRIGTMPIPPYIREPLADPSAYQTVYAREEGSVAAPTAGLHFTPTLLDRLAGAGIELVFLTLHVGPGTFRPVKTPDPSQHHLDAEWYRLGPEAADRINRARDEGRRIIAVGTTVVRTLESLADDRGHVAPTEGETALFILPGHAFRCVDAMITNFHLPRSTLIMLVAAFAGRERILAAYREAIALRYRFYSFGDAMLIED
ncbi:MAG TPA: tRNA preQ1(34) S-adenosylmethionine ribosyltransferase-isomerase QueA [Chloroflexota bacterium]|nr:tRNA preQ1(34) S-adenosylmethionine ribosyltransferase-isomerase QueA [Chloroflexota bacterium]